MFALCSYKIKSKRMSVWRKDTGLNPPTFKPSKFPAHPGKALKVFLFGGFSFSLLSPEPIYLLASKSKESVTLRTDINTCAVDNSQQERQEGLREVLDLSVHPLKRKIALATGYLMLDRPFYRFCKILRKESTAVNYFLPLRVVL